MGGCTGRRDKEQMSITNTLHYSLSVLLAGFAIIYTTCASVCAVCVYNH